MSTRRKSFIAVIASLGLVLGTALSGPAFANPNYPSAAEVAAAKANVTAKQNMIVRIENLIADLEDELEPLNREASIKSEIYNVAKEEVAVVTRKVEVLRVQAEDALACGWVSFINAPVRACVELGNAVGQSVSDLVRKLGGQMPAR